MTSMDTFTVPDRFTRVTSRPCPRVTNFESKNWAGYSEYTTEMNEQEARQERVGDGILFIRLGEAHKGCTGFGVRLLT